MRRSAAQKASRRLRRRMRSTFPLTTLPVELQLQVLCKCDLLSIRRILGISSNLRNLVRKFPETTLHDIFEQIPAPILSLLRVSRAFSIISDDDFDPTQTLDLLLNSRLDEWPSLYPRILADNDDPLETLNDLIDLYHETDVAAGLIAQSMNAVMETAVNPYVVIQPIQLSATERVRLQYSVAMVRLFHQLRLRFDDQSDQGQLFPTVFAQALYPWQIQQCLSVQTFLRLVGIHCDFYLYRLIDKKYSSAEMLSQKSSFIQRYVDMVHQGPIHHLVESNAFILAATASSQHSSRPPWEEGPCRLGDPKLASPFSIQVRSHGFSCYEALLHHGGYMVITKYRPFFSNLGIFFWDLDRLTAWGFGDPADFSEAAKAYPENYHEMLKEHHGGSNNWPVCKERVEAQQIIEWTRCPIECQFEEWLYQEVALARYVEGRPPFPLEYLMPGTHCYNCGLRGHRAYWCLRGKQGAIKLQG